jgi:Bacteriophage CI repressor helix-turn-helix domain
MEIQEIIDRAGGMQSLAALLHVNYSTVAGWKMQKYIPAAHILSISQMMDIPLADLNNLVRKRG